MPQYDRSGRSLTGIKAGRWKCLRQQLMHTGERMQPGVVGEVRFGALREQIQIPLHCTYLFVWTPMRYLWNGWVQYVKDGYDGTTSPPTEQLNIHECLGIGGSGAGNLTIYKFWRQNYLRIYNWHMKWPTDSDATTIQNAGLDARKYGLKAVQLEHALSRAMKDTLTAADYTITTAQSGSREKFTLRDIALLQGRLRTETDRMWFGENRYREILQRIWDVSGVHDAEEVPTVIHDERRMMTGEDLWATDGDSLGQVAGIMQWPVNHWLPFPFTAPEGGILSEWICVRAEPIFSSQHTPFMRPLGSDHDYATLTADEEILGKMAPQDLLGTRYDAHGSNSDNFGKVPAGQHWRTGWDNIATEITERESYPLWDRDSGRSTKYHYAHSIDDAFISQHLGNAIVNVRHVQLSDSKVPLPMQSVMAGT